MPAHHEQLVSPYAPAQLFALVVDIEKYPEFLPWCRAARITERSGNQFLGELVVSFSHITESYVSRVTLDAPHAVDAVMVSGPFEYLTNRWRFSPAPDGGTLIDFALDFKFRSRILEKLIGSLFTKAQSKMIAAFNQRADALYGSNNSGGKS